MGAPVSVWILAADHRDPGVPSGHRLRFDGQSGGVQLAEVTDALIQRIDAALAACAPWLLATSALSHGPKPRAAHCDSSPLTHALAVVKDPSLELSVALWRASRWTGLGVPDDVYATGTVAADGAIGRVGSVDTKCLAVPDGARVLVHKDNEADVPERCAAVVVGTLNDALKAVWPDPTFPDDRLDRRKTRATAEFVRKTMGAAPWRAIAAGLARQDRADPVVAAALSIALRHAGEPVPLERRAAAMDVLLAHYVQGAADAGQQPWREVAREAERSLLAEPRNDSEAQVFGALGRLHSAWRDYDPAVRWLDGAIRYFGSWGLAEASHVLCERLRIAGIRGETLDDALIQDAFACLDAQEARNRPFLETALLRYARQRPSPEIAGALDGRLTHGVSGLWARLCGLPAAPLDPEEEALLALHEDPDDADAIERLRASGRGARRDLERFEDLLAPGERLGAVVAREWRY